MYKEIHSKVEFASHLKERGLTPDVRCWIDWNTEQVWFPLWSVTHRLIGYQRYSWRAEKVRSNKGKYFTWITEAYKPLVCWGLSSLTLPHASPQASASQRVLVCEGIWDAMRCIQAGYPAVAVLGATPNRQYVQWFKMVMQGKECIGILDNDENGAGKGLDKLCSSSIMCEWHGDIGAHNYYEAREWLALRLKPLEGCTAPMG